MHPIMLHTNVQEGLFATQIGQIPLRATSSVIGQIKSWSGSAFVAKPIKVWNGASWVVKQLKRWNGSSWVVTPY